MDTYSVHTINPIGQNHLIMLRQKLQDGPVLITTHDNPDPDALASGKAINHLINNAWRMPTQLIYGGLVGRAENRAMLKLLTPEWQHVDQCEADSRFTAVIYVDCQPGSNNGVSFAANLPVAVIDHHYPITEQTNQAVYKDIRHNVGSTVTMIFQYLDAAKLLIDPVLATAMFLGIKADTNGLSRDSTISDGIAYVKLLEMLDQQLLSQIETAGLAQEYYQAFYQGIHDARLFGKSMVTNLGVMHRPDLTAELADLLFRYEDIHAVLCLGIYKDILHFSIRTAKSDQDAGLIVQSVIFPPGKAGGHSMMAGGQIPLEGLNTKEIISKLELRFLKRIGAPTISTPLLQSDIQER